MDIDWSKAPEGATHYCIGGDSGTAWRDLSGVGAKYWSEGKWHDHYDISSEFCLKYGVFEARPTQNGWNGEGLPPVGTVCEHEPDGFSDKWVTVEVLAHREFKGHDTGLLVVFATEDDVSFSSPECFRSIKTKEQLAAEEREKAIEDMVALVTKGQDYSVQAETGISTADYVRDTCKQLHDAGYRRITDAKD